MTPKIKSASLYDLPFWSYKAFWDKHIEWLQSNLEHYTVRGNYISVFLVSPSLVPDSKNKKINSIFYFFIFIFYVFFLIANIQNTFIIFKTPLNVSNALKMFQTRS